MSDTITVSPLRQRMIEDMVARKLGPHSQRSHIYSCKRFAAYLKRSPETATADDVRDFQRSLIESGTSIGNRNRIMTGVKFLLKITLRRHDLAAEIYHLKEPLKLPPVLAADEVQRLLACIESIKVRVLLSLCYGCGMRGGEVVRLKGSATSTPRRASSASCKPKAARIATSCCRRMCCSCCASIGRNGRGTTMMAFRLPIGGCSPAGRRGTI